MALLYPRLAQIQNSYRLLPANYYARPAMPVFYRGLNGFGQANRLATQNVEQQLKQWAVSPFSVNSDSYMERIRKQYGYADNGAYETMGTIGGIVGAGVGALLGSGFIQSPFKVGFLQSPIKKFNIFKADAWQSPFVSPEWRSPFNKNFDIKTSPKRTSRHNVLFSGASKETLEAIKNNPDLVKAYNDSVDIANKAKKAKKTAERAANKIAKNIRDQAKQSGMLIKKAEDAVTTATKNLDEAKASLEAVLKANPSKHTKAYRIAKQNLDAATEAATKASAGLDAIKATAKSEDILDAAETAAKALRAADAVKDATNAVEVATDALKAANITTDATRAGTKIAGKATGLLPWVGLAADTASLALSAAALKQSIEAGDTFNTVFNSIALGADTLAVVGDVLEFIPPLAPAGFVISIIAGVVSIGVSALQGWLAGETVGHSLTPEGAKAQRMFAENLYAGIIQRPISSVVTSLTVFGLPAVLGAFSRIESKNIFGRALSGIGTFLTSNALGVQARAALSMGAVQLVSGLTEKLDQKLPWAPENPEDVSFVSAISLYGDINDNLFGATRNKAILLGLVKNDPNAMIEGIARSWGNSDKMYHSISFDDVRQAAGIEGPPIVNSFISILGEILVDPQNFTEAVTHISQERFVADFVDAGYQVIKTAGVAAMTSKDPNVTKLGTLLGDKQGLFYGIGPQEAKRILSRLVRQVLADPHKDALKDEFNKIVISLGKASRIQLDGAEVFVYADKIRDQYDALHTLISEGMEGKFGSWIGVTEPIKQTVAKNIEQYKKILEDIKEGKKKLSEDETKLK